MKPFFCHYMKKTIFLSLLAIILLGLSTSNLFAQSNRYSFQKFGNSNGDTLQYRMLFPDANPKAKYPLVIFLHGSGERGKDNEAQLKWGALQFASDQFMFQHPSIVIAPQCPEGQQWSNFKRDAKSTDIQLLPNPSKPMELLLDLIRTSIQKLPVDTNRVYISGLSMGGFGVFDAISRAPELFAAAIPVCGGGDTSRVNSFSKIPIWMFHGAQDGAVNPQLSMNMAAALFKVGANPGLTMYPTVGHFSWLGAYTDQPMIEWLYNQHK
jgi:predicted peptidase